MRSSPAATVGGYDCVWTYRRSILHDGSGARQGLLVSLYLPLNCVCGRALWSPVVDSRLVILPSG